MKSLICTPEQVCRLLNGLPIQMRDVVKPQPPPSLGYQIQDDPGFAVLVGPDFPDVPGDGVRCPFQVGMKMWVGEKVVTPGPWNIPEVCKLWYSADGPCPFKEAVQFKSAVYMPRWASRLTVEVVEVRVQRVQEISVEDAQGERLALYAPIADSELGFGPRERFRELWDSRHPPEHNWGSDPWVWARTYKRIAQEADA